MTTMTLFQRTVSKENAEYFYLKVAIEFVDSETSTDSLTFKLVVTKALRDLFGDAGAAIPVDILGFWDQTMEAILRVPGRSVVKLWSALSLLSECSGEECAIRVKQLLALFEVGINCAKMYTAPELMTKPKPKTKPRFGKGPKFGNIGLNRWHQMAGPSVRKVSTVEVLRKH